MKTLLVTICRRAREGKLPFLLVGGNAVILHGVPRFTRDVDIMITDVHRQGWRDLIQSLGYQAYNKNDAFEQFEAKSEGGVAIDLMLVDQSTWDKLYPAATEVDIDGGERAKIPDPLHLISMKLNASRSPNRRAGAPDLDDAISLIKSCRIDTQDPRFKEVIDRYASFGDRAIINDAFPDNA